MDTPISHYPILLVTQWCYNISLMKNDCFSWNVAFWVVVGIKPWVVVIYFFAKKKPISESRWKLPLFELGNDINKILNTCKRLPKNLWSVKKASEWTIIGQYPMSSLFYELKDKHKYGKEFFQQIFLLDVSFCKVISFR